MRKVRSAEFVAILAGTIIILCPEFADARPVAKMSQLAVGAQYGTTHAYIPPEDMDRFTSSFLATFGGRSSQPSVATITPTPSVAQWQALTTPVGVVSVLAFKTPIPYPFGQERISYLVTDIDAAVRAAKKQGAAILVAPFPDAIGRDVIVQWPGGVNIQFYWHAVAPSSPGLKTVPESRVYVAAERATEFIRSFVAFAQGRVVSDNAMAPGVEIGRPGDTYRRVRIESMFGKITVLVTDGHLPYPYGHEMTGYDVPEIAETLTKAKASGATILIGPYKTDGREAAIVDFPGGYIAEIHSSAK
jgi:predicted enzyme related to lactoylglutathione lyase